MLAVQSGEEKSVSDTPKDLLLDLDTEVFEIRPRGLFGEKCEVSAVDPKTAKPFAVPVKSQWRRMRAILRKYKVGNIQMSSPAVTERRAPWFVPPRVYKDFVALTARSTTRHILLRTKEECLQVQQELAAARINGEFVVDAFAAKARECSLAGSKVNGGLLGIRLRQGACRDPELDEACFSATIGRVTGPVKSSHTGGYHLVLVEERLGMGYCEDGMSRVVPRPRPNGGVDSVLAPAEDENAPQDALSSFAGFTAVSVAGGTSMAVMAGSIDVGAIANSMP
jgi:parvulin-like peptidyl-prolyl isomerase